MKKQESLEEGKHNSEQGQGSNEKQHDEAKHNEKQEGGSSGDQNNRA